MDRERLNELLQDPSLAGKQDLAALRSMAERFPWFSGAHLLLAVGEHGAGDVLANDRQSNLAAFLPSRAVLYDLVRKEDGPQPAPLRIVKEETSAPTLPAKPADQNIALTNAPAPKPDVAPVILQARDVAQPPIPEDQSLPLPGASRELEAQASTTAHPPTEELATAPLEEALPEGRTGAEILPLSTATEPLAAKPSPPEQPASPPDILDLQIEEAIRASGFDVEQLAALPSLPKEEEVAETQESPAATAPPSALPAAVQEFQAPALKKPVSTITPTSRLKFTDWLDQQEPVADSPVAPPATISPTLPSAPEEPLAHKVIPPPPFPKPSSISPEEIMEQFIQRSVPSAIKAKASFFNPQQAAKKSLVDDGLVSETLARILEKQGNYTKAKEVYDRLALKHPEKSVYFAALSKALEGRSNK